MTNGAPIRLPEALRQLPPVPRALARALQLIQNPDSERSELVQVLSLDPGLTGTFLRMVNSAYYGLPRRITSLSEAVGYLGYETVETVILAASSSKVLGDAVPAYMLERGMLWKHSVAVAAGSAFIAERRQIQPVSEAYVAGLLHDVGKVAIDLMMSHQPHWGHDAGERAERGSWTDTERQVVGHDHAEVGAIMVRSWNLPDRVVEAVSCHHQIEQAQSDPRFTATVHIADVTTLRAGMMLSVDSGYYRLDETALQMLNWGDQEAEELVTVMQEAVSKAEDVLQLQIQSSSRGRPIRRLSLS